MLHLALAALLAGSFGTAALDGPGDADKPDTPKTEVVVGLNADDVTLTDTYAYSFDQEDFLNAWAGFGWGRVDGIYLPDGSTTNVPQATAMRAFLGAHANLVRMGGLTIGLGGQLMVGSEDIEGIGEASFGLHSAKAYLQVAGPVLGVHAGYAHDFDSGGDTDPVHISDGISAWFVGFTFDHQPDWLRVFGGTEMYRFIDFPGHDGTGWDSPSLLVFNLGAGVQFAWVELGVNGYWRTNLVQARAPVVGGGSHQRGIAPYLNLSPDFLPVGLSIRGAVFGDYADYGFSIGGAQDLETQMGFTVALTFGI